MADNETALENELDKQKEETEKKVEKAGKKAEEEAKKEGASSEEVTQAVEKARKEEKDKLYPQIESLKKDLDEVRKILQEEREEKDKIKKDTQKKAEEERQSKLSDQEKTNEILHKLEEQLNNERKEREKFRKDLEEREKKDELRRYREVLIKANEDEIIPELVIGKTKEELDEALEIAKARYKEYAEKFEQKQANDTRRRMPRSTNPDIEGLEDLEISKDLTAIDTDKYLEDENYRKSIQSQLEAEYARLAGRG